MTSASSIGVDVDVTDTSSLLIELGCACDYIHYFAARESTQRGRQGHVRHTSPFFDFGRRLLRVGFEAAVECNDPAHEIAVLHALPSHLLYEAAQLELIGPLADGLGEVDIGLTVGRDRARRRRQGAHDVLQINDAKEPPGAG